MRKSFSKLTALLPIAALMGGLSLAAVSCSDDELSEEEKQQQAEEQAEQGLDDAAEFWSVVGQLTDDPMPDEGWQTATYAPSIGEPDGANTAVRIVATNDAETAAARFAMLTGADINESTTDYTYQNEHVGTLRYHRTGGQSLAVVDVDIKQMPGLTQIIYQAPEGDNGYFNGTAYYRFGDVVKKLNSDGAYDYWICVRPAFGPAKKGDSHWISVSKIPSANTKQVTKIINKEKITHSLPKSLTTNREHMQNLAEMLYAMTHAQQWASNLSTNNGYKTLKYFRDFNYQTLFDYHADAFFYEMAFNWERKGLFQSVFGVTRDEMKAELEQNGLNLVYSSATMSGNKILLPTATYNGTNLKTETLAKTNSEWTTAFNIQTQMKPYLAYTDASGNQKRAWLVRYATGATLCKGSTEAASFDKYKRLTNCEDIFVFNKDVRQLDMTEDNLKKKEPEKTHDNPTAWNLDDYVGEPFYEHGDVLVDEYGHRWFVVNQAGTPDVVGYQSETKGEKIPFAEVVCFEGFNYSADRKTATNLPSREEAIRGAFWLDLFFHQSTSVTNLKRGTKEYWIEKNKYAHLGSSVFNVLEYAGVEIRDLLQLISAQNGNPRQTSQAASIAYNDGSGRMRLLRYIANNQFSDNEFRYYLWDHYVSNPDATTLLYPDIAYSSVPIYLDDLTDKSKIIAYAEDSYVRQGQPDAEFPTNIGVPSRLPRTEVEPLAADASNCAYNIDRWRDRTFLADMWKAPILMFRITHIYDRGATDHALTAANGLMMVRIKKHEWEDNDGDDAELNYNQFRTMVFPAQYATCIKPGAWKLDGKDFEFPSWQSLYK